MSQQFAQGLLVLFLGAVVLLTAPWVARWNRKLLRRASDYEQGYRWTSRLFGSLLIVLGVARMLGWAWPLNA